MGPTQPFFQSQAFAETAKLNAEEEIAEVEPAGAPAASDDGLKTPNPLGEVMDRMSSMQNRMEALFVNNREMVVDQFRNFEDRLAHVETRYSSSIKIQDEKSNLFQKYVIDQTNSMHTQIRDLADRMARYERTDPVVHEGPIAPPRQDSLDGTTPSRTPGQSSRARSPCTSPSRRNARGMDAKRARRSHPHLRHRQDLPPPSNRSWSS